MNMTFLTLTKTIALSQLALNVFNLNLATVHANSASIEENTNNGEMSRETMVEEPSISRKLERRIINGEFVDPNTYPWFTHFGGGECGGMLIAPDFVLTAAHCTIGRTISSVKVGKLSYSKADNGGQKVEPRSVSWKREHPGYNDRTLTNDSALLQLSTLSTIKPVAIDGIGKLSEDYNGGERLWAIGFGLDENNQYPDDLKHVEVGYLTNTQCKNTDYDRNEIYPNMMCAAETDKDSCSGDSGGPLYDANAKVVVGIVSWGYGCAEAGYPGVYSRISTQFDWIKSQVCARSAAPPSWCGTTAPTKSSSPTGAISPSPTKMPTIAPTILTCGTNEKRFSMFIQNDDYPDETSWNLINSCTGEIVLSGDEITATACLDENTKYTYTIYDSIGDGICCGYGVGFYKLYLDGQLIQQGGSFLNQESTVIGPQIVCIQPPTASPTAFKACAANEDELTVRLTLDRFGVETSWSLYNLCTNETFSFGNTTEKLCIVSDHDYVFTIYDRFGDGMCCDHGDGGYELFNDGVLFAEGDEFQFEESKEFGGGSCVGTTPSSSPTGSGGKCQVEEFLGSTIYLPLAGSCFKIELFPDGVIAADPTDPDCSNEVHSSSVMSNFDSFDSNGNVYFVSSGPNGYSGKFEFEENDSFSELSAIPRQLPDANNGQYFILGLIYPSCDQGPIYPVYYKLLQPQILFPVSGYCVRAQLYQGGVLSLDVTDASCTNPVYTESINVSVFNGGHGNEAVFSPLSNNGWDGRLEFYRDTTATDIDVKKNKLDTTSKEFDIVLTLPASYFP